MKKYEKDWRNSKRYVERGTRVENGTGSLGTVLKIVPVSFPFRNVNKIVEGTAPAGERAQ